MMLRLLFLAIAVLAICINVYVVFKFLGLVKDVRYMLLTVINIKEALGGKETNMSDAEIEC